MFNLKLLLLKIDKRFNEYMKIDSTIKQFTKKLFIYFLKKSYEKTKRSSDRLELVSR